VEILFRSIALAAGVHVPPEVNIIPPRRRRHGRPIRAALGRTLSRFGAIASRVGRWLADDADNQVAASQVPERT